MRSDGRAGPAPTAPWPSTCLAGLRRRSCTTRTTGTVKGILAHVALEQLYAGDWAVVMACVETLRVFLDGLDALALALEDPGIGLLICDSLINAVYHHLELLSGSSSSSGGGGGGCNG